MEDPYPQFTYLARTIRKAYPRLAYLHVVEPRNAGGEDREALADESNDFLRVIWKEGQDPATTTSQYLCAGGHTAQTALEDAEKLGGLIVFGRYFLANVRNSVRPYVYLPKQLIFLGISL